MIHPHVVRAGLGIILAVLAFVPPPRPSPTEVPARENVLAPTRHYPVPNDPTLIWLVPAAALDDGAKASDATLSELSAAVSLIATERAEPALSKLEAVPIGQSVLGDYVQYYRGVALFQLGRLDEARETLRVVRNRGPVGHLWEAVTLKAAEVAEAQEGFASAVELYTEVSAKEMASPDLVWHRIGEAAIEAGDSKLAAKAFSRVYYGFPLSDLARSVPERERFDRDLARAQRLFGARRYTDAREAFTALLRLARGEDRDQIGLRIAECDYYLQRYWPAIDGLRPFLARGANRAEADYFYTRALRAVGRHDSYVTRTRRSVEEFPDESWAEEALNHLGTHYVLVDDDETAAGVFAELYRRFPRGARAERAAWKAGWWAHRQGRLEETIRYFESAAAAFPRSDYRPAYLYWAARSHVHLGDRATGYARLSLVRTDYANTYYGRLATRMLRDGEAEQVVRDGLASDPQVDRGAAPPESSLPPMPANETVIRQLLMARLYDEAQAELTYAQGTWGSSPAIEATLAWVYNRKGELRLGINAMKRAYPQYMTADGAGLPEFILRVIFPRAHWPLIFRHATARGLDPYLVTALIGQESTFDPKIRSSANAYGLMQIVPSTGRRLARQLGLRYRLSMLTNPETNVRMGTRYFTDLLARFGEPYLALAAYNAGEHRVERWLEERRDADLAEDEFIDDIPFPETQNYVKRILGAIDAYRRLYGSE